MLRRTFFEVLSAGAAVSARSHAAETPPSKIVTRHIDEMTSREVESYLKDGGDLVFVPFGPVSGHGALIPMGMHAHWATALSVLLAEKANGLVFPTTFACFAGATRTFRGTVSFPINEQVSVLKRIASTLARRRLREDRAGCRDQSRRHGRDHRRTILVRRDRVALLVPARLPHPGHTGNQGHVRRLSGQLRRDPRGTRQPADPRARAAHPNGEVGGRTQAG